MASGHENLIPLNKRTKDEQRNIQSAGGKKSGEVRRRKAALRDTMNRLLTMQVEVDGLSDILRSDGGESTYEEVIAMAMIQQEVQDVRIRDAGCHLIQIDSHSGARPKCAKDQGKIFDLNNGSGYTEDLHGKKIRYYPWKSSSYGEPDGILGINCGHHKWPFIPGVNIQRHFPTENMNANDKLK